MERTDIPAILRGHRSALFGNLEKLRDFHQSQLLPELEKFQSYPHRIAGIFLRYVSFFFQFQIISDRNIYGRYNIGHKRRFFLEGDIRITVRHNLNPTIRTFQKNDNRSFLTYSIFR